MVVSVTVGTRGVILAGTGPIVVPRRRSWAVSRYDTVHLVRIPLAHYGWLTARENLVPRAPHRHIHIPMVTHVLVRVRFKGVVLAGTSPMRFENVDTGVLNYDAVHLVRGRLTHYGGAICTYKSLISTEG